MTSHADVAVVRSVVAKASRRIAAQWCIGGAAAGVAVAAIAMLVTRLAHHSLDGMIWWTGGLAAIGALGGFVLSRARARHAALLVERDNPHFKNVLITADELAQREHTDAPSYVHGLVFRDAARLSGNVDVSRAIPLLPVAGALAVGLVLCVAIALWPTTPLPTTHDVQAAAATSPAILGVDVEIVPPAYLARGTSHAGDPSRIDAFAGSRLRFSVRARGARVVVETLHGRRDLDAAAGETFTGEVIADADGFIAIEPVSVDGHPGPRRLIGLSITADASPQVRITAPGKDIRLADGRHVIDVAIEANDDVGLGSLRLRFTRVSGSGERFTFTDGDVPLSIARGDRRSWKARASWRLDSLALGPGDMVVYRAIATDNRPGAPPVESDSYIAEVISPGGIAAAGFATDPEIERYALSQQMVILKTQQLIARKATLNPDSLPDAAANIAAEQRRVRAEFVFMMGGEVGGADDPSGDLNEIAEASEGDLAAARLLGQGRAALMNAIRLMSRADKALTAVELDAALVQERAALVQLEKTFAHSRIILRALSERERLDATRRLTGTLTDAASDVRPLTDLPGDPRTSALRQSLADIATLASTTAFNDSTASRASQAAERVLRVDPASQALQRIAQRVGDAATAMTNRRDADARIALDAAATDLSKVVRAALLAAPDGAAPLVRSRMAGALADELRRAGIPR